MEIESKIVKLKELNTICTNPFYINSNYHRDCKLDSVQSKEYLESLSKINYAGSIIVSDKGELVNGLHRMVLLCFLINWQIRLKIVPGYEWYEVLHKDENTLQLNYANKDFQEILNTAYVMQNNKFKEVYELCKRDNINLDNLTINIITIKDCTEHQCKEIYKQENTFTEVEKLTFGYLNADTLSYLEDTTYNNTENYLNSYLKYRKIQNLEKIRISDIEVHARMYANYLEGKWKDLSKLNADYLLPVIYKQEEDYGAGYIDQEQYEQNIKYLTGYEVRRQIMRESKPLQEVDQFGNMDNMLKWIQNIGYADDKEIQDILQEKPLYEDSRELTKFLLEKLEESKSTAYKDLSNLTIEHIMPQSIDRYWGNQDKKAQKKYVHTLGNLTLTGYNSEMSNKDFKGKKKYYERFELNRAIFERDYWNIDSIKFRTSGFAKDLMEIFALPPVDNSKSSQITTSKIEISVNNSDNKTKNTTGVVVEECDLRNLTGTKKKVKGMSYRDRQYKADSWNQCMNNLLILVSNEDGYALNNLAVCMPKIVSVNKSTLRTPKRIDKSIDFYYESNLSANDMIKNMIKVLECLHIPADVMTITVEYDTKDMVSKNIHNQLKGYEINKTFVETKDFGILERRLYKDLADQYSWQFKNACEELNNYFYSSDSKLKKSEGTDMGMYYDISLSREKKYDRIKSVLKEMNLENEVKILFEVK